MSSSKTTGHMKCTAQAILQAEPRFLVGKFKVAVNQIKPHSSQRLLSQAWVESLGKRFKEVGIDRAGHPIKVLLEHKRHEDDLVAYLKDVHPDSIPELPNDVSALVYHGQHRVAACKELDDAEEHWWYAEVYKPDLEASYPAEFITLMHSSNEEEYRFHNTDADCFMAMYRLQQLLDKKTIDIETYTINQERLQRGVAKEVTRQSLKNLLRSSVLSDAIAKVLAHPHLRPGFNAGTWGKKLVKGRFYSWVACLIEEMLEQCRLLQGGRRDVHSKPFQLSAQSCTWKHLDSAVKKKSHAWQELDGGAAQALLRVSSRPRNFIHAMNPKGANDWMFEHTALLPSVLTSEHVVKNLNDMYTIAQHLIHMIAGEEYLEKYTSNQAHEADDEHPVGIICIVLQEKLLDKESNYPDKIIGRIWSNKVSLLNDLGSFGISKAAETAKEQYQELLLKSEAWWSLLRLFKLRKLNAGLGLSVPKEFNTSTPASGPGVPIESLHANTAVATPVEPHQASSATFALQTRTPADPQNSRRNLARNPPSSRPAARGLGTVAGSTQQTPNTHGCSTGQAYKKRRLEEEEELEPSEEEVFTGSMVTARNLSTMGEVSGDMGQARMLRCHSRVICQLEQLQEAVPRMTADEAGAMEGLLKAIAELQGTGCMARIVQTLQDQIDVCFGDSFGLVAVNLTQVESP